MLRLVDVDDDARRAGVHAQARRAGGFGGVTLTAEVRVAGGRRAGVLAIAGETAATGDATAAAERALEAELSRRLAFAVLGRDPSPADDPAWRRRLAGARRARGRRGRRGRARRAAWDRRRRT